MHFIGARAAASPHPTRISLAVLAIVAALLSVALGPAAARATVAPGADGASTADNSTPLKAVIIVGPTHSSTSNYLSRGESLAQVAESYGMDVRRVFHPRATPERVLEHIQGANLVAYLGHGNGWPSPYAPFQERTKNGFGLNPYEGGSASDVYYRGGNWIRDNVTLAPGAVVLLNGLCYAEGNGESGMAIPSWSVAHERVDNYAAAFLYVGARAVFAYGWQSVNSVVDMLHTTNKTVDEIFMTKGATSSPSSGFIGWNNKRLDSVRMPGFRNHLDPHSTYGFLRALSGTLTMTAAEWRGGEPLEWIPPPSNGPTVPEGLTGVARDNRVVELSWQASTSNIIGTIKYRVFRNGSAIGTQQTALTYTDQPSKTGSFQYQVRAIDAAGNKSDLSPAISVQVVESLDSSTPPPTTGVTVPQGLTATAHDNFVVKLAWEASTSSVEGTIRYRVFRNGSAIGTQQTALTYTDQRKKVNTFRYQVRAIDGAGNKSDLSPAVTITTVKSTGGAGLVGPDTTPPSVPAGLATEALGYRYIRVTWNASTDDREGAIEYRLFRNDRRIAIVKDVTTITDRPKNAGTHTYTVRAIDAAGNKSAFSPYVTGQAIKGPL